MSDATMDLLTWIAVGLACVSVTAAIIVGRRSHRGAKQWELDHPLFEADHLHINRERGFTEVYAEGTKWPSSLKHYTVEQVPVNMEVLVHVFGSLNLLMVINSYTIGVSGQSGIVWYATDKQTMERRYKVEV
jgi:hypothetical protein